MPFDDPGYLSRYEPVTDTPYVAKLALARELILNGWVKGDAAVAPMAHDPDDDEDQPDFITCDPNDPKATKFCTIGALQRAWGTNDAADFFLKNGEPQPDVLILGFVNKSPDPINDPLNTARFDADDHDYVKDPGTWNEIPEWNDDAETDKDTVLAVFDKAIAFARAKGL